MLVRAFRNLYFLAFTIEKTFSTWAVPGNTDAILPTKQHRNSKRPFTIDQQSSNETSSLHAAITSCKSGSVVTAWTRSWCPWSISSIAGRLHPDNNRRSCWVWMMQQNSECGKTNNFWGTTDVSSLLLLFATFFSKTKRLTPVVLPRKSLATSFTRSLTSGKARFSRFSITNKPRFMMSSFCFSMDA